MDTNSSDKLLIEQALAGEQQAFSLLVRRYQSTVNSTVIGMLGAGADADDVAQEVMLTLFQSLGSYKSQASLKTWLTRIAINRSIDCIRRRKRWLKWFSSSEEELGPEFDKQAQWQSPDNQETSLARLQVLQAAFAKLPPHFRSVALLRLVQGYSSEEVADILDIPQGTVLSRLARARKQLCQYLGRQ